MKKLMKKSVSLLIVLALMISTGVSTFAVTGTTIETADGNLSVTQISEDMCMMSDGSSVAFLTTIETENGLKVALSGEEENDNGYF